MREGESGSNLRFYGACFGARFSTSSLSIATRIQGCEQAQFKGAEMHSDQGIVQRRNQSRSILAATASRRAETSR